MVREIASQREYEVYLAEGRVAGVKQIKKMLKYGDREKARPRAPGAPPPRGPPVNERNHCLPGGEAGSVGSRSAAAHTHPLPRLPRR